MKVLRQMLSENALEAFSIIDEEVLSTYEALTNM